MTTFPMLYRAEPQGGTVDLCRLWTAAAEPLYTPCVLLVYVSKSYCKLPGLGWISAVAGIHHFKVVLSLCFKST